MECLIQVIGTQLESLAKLCSDHDQKIGEDCMTNKGKDSALFTIARSGNAGKSRNEVTQERIHGLREALGFHWVDIARMLGMPTRKLRVRAIGKSGFRS